MNELLQGEHAGRSTEDLLAGREEPLGDEERLLAAAGALLRGEQARHEAEAGEGPHELQRAQLLRLARARRPRRRWQGAMPALAAGVLGLLGGSLLTPWLPHPGPEAQWPRADIQTAVPLAPKSGAGSARPRMQERVVRTAERVRWAMTALAVLDRAGVQVDIQQLPGVSVVLSFDVPPAPDAAVARLLQEVQVTPAPGQPVQLDVVAAVP
jgi:hypothetical protein